jgi:hypothetical protein
VTYPHYIVDEPGMTLQVDLTGIYLGQALAGSATSDPLWRIQKITTAGSNIQIAWANAVPTYTNVWDDRATYTYS